MTYNEELQSNNAELEEVLQAVNELPEAGSGTSVQADWNQTDETAADFIKNKPVVGSGDSNALTWNYDDVEEGDFISPNIPIFKINDVAPRMNDVESIEYVEITASDGTETRTQQVIPEIVEAADGAVGMMIYVDVSLILYFVNKEAVGVEIDGLTFEEAGTYTMFTSGLTGITLSVTIPGFSFGTTKFDPSYLYQPDWDQPDESQPDAIKNKPFGAVLSEAGDTITWDGVFEGLVATEEQENEGLAVRAVKISPNVITAEDVASGVSVGAMTIGGTIETTTVPAEEAQAAFQDDGFAIIGTSLYFVPKAGYEYTSNDTTIVFPEPGIYSLGVLAFGEHSFAALYVTSLTIPGYGKLRGYSVKRISDYYLPESFAYIRIRSNVIGSSKVFMLTVNDSGTLSVSEVTT